MAITPQAIKDQEFQIKFRGFDTIEVKAFLESIAEEFFELFEQIRLQSEELQTLADEKQDLLVLHAKLESDMSTLIGKNDRLKAEVKQGGEQVANRDKEIADLRQQIAVLEDAKVTAAQEIAKALERVEAEKESAEGERRERQILEVRLAEIERRQAEDQKAEIDFKETLVAAQKFSRDMKKTSEEEARETVENARAEAEKLRQETLQELARYPKEIERLKAKRNQVREDLRTVLTLCIDNLDIFAEESEEEEDLSDLYQSIVVADDGSVNPEDLSKLDMELDLLSSIGPDKESMTADERDPAA